MITFIILFNLYFFTVGFILVKSSKTQNLKNSHTEKSGSNTIPVSIYSVVSSGSYMISSATFPSYFLKDDALVTGTHARLDATLFTRIAKELNLTCRYVGEEPFSAATSAYNDALAAILPDAGVELRVIPRKEQEGMPISASYVRKLIHDGKIEEIRELVPQTTYDYLTSEKGARAIAAIKASDNVIHH